MNEFPETFPLIVRLPIVIEGIKYDYISCVFMKIYRVNIQNLSKYIVYIIQYGEIKCYEMFWFL